MVGSRGRTARLGTAYPNMGEVKSPLLQAYDENVTIRQTLPLMVEAMPRSRAEGLQFQARARWFGGRKETSSGRTKLRIENERDLVHLLTPNLRKVGFR